MNKKIRGARRFALGHRSLAPLIAAIALLGLLPASAAATSATITGGTTENWTTGKVDNISVTFTNCNDGSGLPCPWSAVAGIQPTDFGGCPSQWVNLLGEVFWTASSSSDGTLSSGPKTFPLDGFEGQRICVYWVGKIHVLAPNPIDPGTGKPLCTPNCGYLEIPNNTVLTNKLVSLVQPPPAAPPAAPPVTVADPACTKAKSAQGKAQKAVKQLKGKLAKATKPAAKAALRAKLSKAKATLKSAATGVKNKC